MSQVPLELVNLQQEARREVAASGAGEGDERKEKSMVRLTQRFIQMFLLGKAPTLGLEEAATALLGESDDPGQMKTKVRRLYDIANILW